eukprot:CAMPEP_0194770074 /NCGR_PEP_ID=MMETSP0323_2-20130528/45090_1 /TAXON_ID=2866 ORGANISM="Crypthecodinium cohnii, Strain Seligo" /NCGR_SAMPLE_ID=MMETSP0323_2 /ASSEMBLY_ACC=CAM_ASM_000346 /LENGTH=177 /DNA_ID=CAMNT_0039703423 /DNA_START=59 /DNA_END=590 /DNA_ORIENTATION=-
MSEVMSSNVRTPLGALTAVAELVLLCGLTYLMGRERRRHAYGDLPLDCQHLAQVLLLYIAYFAITLLLNVTAILRLHVSKMAIPVALFGILSLALLIWSMVLLARGAPESCDDELYSALSGVVCYHLVEMCCLAPLEVGREHVHLQVASAREVDQEGGYFIIPEPSSSKILHVRKTF